MFVSGPAPTRHRLRIDPTRYKIGLLVAVALAACPLSRASAVVLDFGAALQKLEAGEIIETVQAVEGGWMLVDCDSDDSHGPDACVLFDSEEPGDQADLGTPNQDFGGPGVGDGGERGAEGENSEELANVLVIAADDKDVDDDGLVDTPRAAAEGGRICLTFSHAGHLTLTLVDIDDDRQDARIELYHEDDHVGTFEAEALGNNSAQTLDLSEFGNVDRVCIQLEGTAAIGAIRLEVEQVGVQSKSWAGIKTLFR